MVERLGGVCFHNIKALDGMDVTFIGLTLNPEITVEKIGENGIEESIEVTWKYFSEEALDEIVEIIHDSNYGITH